MNIPVILADPIVDKLVIIENCRKDSDREYISNIDKYVDNRFLYKLKIVKKSSLGEKAGNGWGNSYMSECIDQNTMYLKIDDDVLYIKPGSIKCVFDSRLNNSNAKLIYPNIINNLVTDFIREKNLSQQSIEDYNITVEDCIANTRNYKDIQHAFKQHSDFIEGKCKCFNSELKIARQFMHSYFIHRQYFIRFSINAICFFGKDMLDWTNKFFNNLDLDDEECLTKNIFASKDDYSIVTGNAVVAHYGYYVHKFTNSQRRYIIDGYRQMLSKEYPEINFKFEQY